jgi:hypothetical protein
MRPRDAAQFTVCRHARPSWPRRQRLCVRLRLRPSRGAGRRFALGCFRSGWLAVLDGKQPGLIQRALRCCASSPPRARAPVPALRAYGPALLSLPLTIPALRILALRRRRSSAHRVVWARPRADVLAPETCTRPLAASRSSPSWDKNSPLHPVLHTERPPATASDRQRPTTTRASDNPHPRPLRPRLLPARASDPPHRNCSRPRPAPVSLPEPVGAPTNPPQPPRPPLSSRAPRVPLPLAVHWVSLSARAVPHNPRRALPQPLRPPNICSPSTWSPNRRPSPLSLDPDSRRPQALRCDPLAAVILETSPPKHRVAPRSQPYRRTEPPARHHPAVIRPRPLAPSLSLCAATRPYALNAPTTASNARRRLNLHSPTHTHTTHTQHVARRLLLLASLPSLPRRISNHLSLLPR